MANLRDTTLDTTYYDPDSAHPSRLIYNSEATISDGDATPDVSAGNLFVTANTTPTTITEFDSGTDGQVIVIRVNDANTTFEHNNGVATDPLILIGTSDITAESGEFYTFEFRNSQWYNTNIGKVSGGDTLDSSYDGPDGAGSGRAIIVDSGSVDLDNRQTSGTIQDIRVGAATTLAGDLYGIDIDLGTNVTPSGNNTIGVRVQSGIITCPDGTNSERFGLNTEATGNVCSAFGNAAKATQQECTAIGANTNARRPRTTIVGEGSTGPGDAGSADAIIIGANTNLSGSNLDKIACFGNNVDLAENNQSNLFIFSWDWDDRNTAISNSVVFGSDASPIQNLYVGDGHATQETTPSTASIRGAAQVSSGDSRSAQGIQLVGGAHNTGNTTLTDASSGVAIVQGGDIVTTGSNLVANCGKTRILGRSLNKSIDTINCGDIDIIAGVAQGSSTTSNGGSIVVEAGDATGTGTTNNAGSISLRPGDASGAGTNNKGNLTLKKPDGTNQIEINSTGLGFFNATPVAQSAAYSVTNVTTDRSYDANSTTLNELSDVVGTVIADLQALGLLGQ